MFSSNVNEGNRRRPSGTSEIPRRTRRKVRSVEISSPSKVIVPDVWVCRPAIVRNNVDFPAPFAPMMARTSPTPNVKLTSSTAQS